jgi:hypothetical protein
VLEAKAALHTKTKLNQIVICIFIYPPKATHLHVGLVLAKRKRIFL